MSQVIVVGGGLAGCSAAHTALEHGANVLLLDKSAFLGGNSVKATSGINGAGTRLQRQKGVPDTAEIFYADTLASAKELARPALIRRLTYDSASSVEWIDEKFIKFDTVARMGGASQPRCHRGDSAGRFPGAAITMKMIGQLEELNARGERVRIITRARVTELLREDGGVCGVKYEHNGRTLEARGPVIICTGGYGADFADDSLLAKYRPDLLHLSTTNGTHCTGDGVKLCAGAGARLADMECVQVHPTGCVDPKDPKAKVLMLAAEALRGTGGILLDKNGQRFCNDVGTRDYVTECMIKHAQGPYRLVLNKATTAKIAWHCQHYVGRGLMKVYASGAELARDMGVPESQLSKSLADYSAFAEKKSDPFGRQFFENAPYRMDDEYHAVIVTPVIHYTMGGVETDDLARVVSTSGTPLRGLYIAGEAAGGVHGKNRLGGSSLLDCVVFGRLAGRLAAAQLLQDTLKGGQGTGAGVSVTLTPKGPGQVSVDVKWGGAGAREERKDEKKEEGREREEKKVEEKVEKKDYTMEEVKKMAEGGKLVVVVKGEVLDCTKFADEHPGGRKAIELFNGKDATKEFDMIHDEGTVQKYAPHIVIGKVKPQAKL